MANNPIQSHDLYQPGATDTIATLQASLVQIQAEMKGIVAAARALKIALAGTGGVGNSKSITDAATQTEKLRQQQERTKQAYARTQATLQRLIVTQNQAAASANRLAVSENQAAASALRLEAAQKRADSATKKHTGSMTGLIGSIRNLAYAYFSLGAAAQIFQNILKQTKALDTLTVAFNTTLGSTQATAQAQEYLLDISERFGANLLGASQAYLKFSAASKQAGVSAEETQKIFTSVTKASSILGLGAERTSYVFLALEQIMSKGRLSTEELRRQLGEHLPGAFGIAAEAMGVTTAKLTDMLKKGEIASTDFLPKFAVQLEKAYGISQVERIDNLAAAQERFNNELTLLVKYLDLSDAFKDLFNNLASLAKFFRDNAEAIILLGKAVVYITGAWLAYTVTTKAAVVATRLMVAAQAALNNVMKLNPIGLAVAAVVLLLPLLDKLRTKTDQVVDSLSDLEKRQKEIEKNTVSANKSLNAQAEAIRKGNLPLDARKKIITELNSKLAPYLDKLLTEESSYADIKRAVDLANESLATRIKLLQIEDEYVNGRTEEAKITEELATLATEIAQIEFNVAEEKNKFSLEEQAGNKVKLDQGISLVKSIKEQQDATDAYNAKIARQTELQARLVVLQEEYRRNGGKDLDRLLKTTIVNDPKDDKFDEEKERIANIFDDQERELAALKLGYERKRADFIANNEDTTKLDQKYRDDRVDILNKYIDIESAAETELDQRKRKELADFAKAYADWLHDRAEGEARSREDYIKFLEGEFDANQDHQLRLLELNGATDEEIAKAEIKAEIAKLDYILYLNEIHGKALTEAEIKRINELKGALGQELLQPFTKDKGEADIFSLFGINFGSKTDEQIDEFKTAFKETIDFIGNELQNFNQLQQDLINQQIEDADRLVAAKENNLNRQIQLAAANQANNVAGAQAELALAKKTQADYIKQRKAAQRAELAIETLSQTQNMITAVTAALKLGPILGPIAVGALFAVFAASKIKALQLINKKTFRKGGFEEIGGGSHESGRDTNVGGNNYAEKGESVGIFTAKATRKYKPSLKALVNHANKGTLENILIQDRRAIQGINMVNKVEVDTALMEKRLTRLVSLSEGKTFVDGRGRLVRIDRGRTTIINR